jgi:hypothetical protein
VQLNFTVQTGNVTSVVSTPAINLAALATRRLTISTETASSGEPNMVVRLDGQEIARPLTGGPDGALGKVFKYVVDVGGTPSPDAGGADSKITRTYSGVVGGYYAVMTGGETSNFSQSQRAAQQLLAASA